MWNARGQDACPVDGRLMSTPNPPKKIFRHVHLCIDICMKMENPFIICYKLYYIKYSAYRVSSTDKSDNLTCEIIYDNFTCKNICFFKFLINHRFCIFYIGRKDCSLCNKLAEIDYNFWRGSIMRLGSNMIRHLLYFLAPLFSQF